MTPEPNRFVEAGMILDALRQGVFPDELKKYDVQGFEFDGNDLKVLFGRRNNAPPTGEA